MKKNFVLSHHNYDLSKRWYIRCQERNKANRLITQKFYGGINHGKTVEERLHLADILLKELSEKNSFPSKKLKSSNKIYDDLMTALETIRPTLRESTHHTYKAKIIKFSTWCAKNGISEVKKITQQNFQKFLNEIIDSKLSKRTYNEYKMTMQRVGALIPHFPVHCIKLIKKIQAQSVPAQYFQKHHIDILKRAMTNDNQMWFVCQTIFFTLIRPGELRLLKISDIDLINATILVRAQISKNKKTERVAIPDDFLPALIKMNLHEYPSHFFLFGKGGVPSAKHWGKGYFQKKHTSILNQFGFDTSIYKLYSWKHTGAVSMVKAGIHIKYIQLQGRWHDLDQVNSYLRQLGVEDMSEIKSKHIM